MYNLTKHWVIILDIVVCLRCAWD